MAFYAYILQCKDCTYYTGQTDDLEKRLAEHREGNKCRYTASRLPVELMWCQTFPTRDQARTAEHQIKNWSQAKKRALIAGDFDLVSTAAKKRNW
jgi:putative endonuclease